RLEAFLLSAGGRAHYPGEQPDASIEDDHRADLSAGEDIVADRYGFEGSGIEDSLIKPLEAAAQQDDAFPCRQLTYAALRQLLSPRGKRQHRAPVRHAVESRSEHIGAKYHPC